MASIVSHDTICPKPPHAAPQRCITIQWKQWSLILSSLANARPHSATSRCGVSRQREAEPPMTQSSSVQRVELPMARDDEPQEQQ